MKKVYLLLFAIVIAGVLNAQHVFNKGDLMFNAGVGAPNSHGFIPTANFSGEIGVIPTGNVGLVSFGGMAEFHIGVDTDPFPRFYVGPRAAWHVHAFKSSEFDAYAGAGFGVAFSGKNDYRSASTNINPDMFVGGRWMFSPGLGLFAEIGYTGFSALKFGLTF